MERENSRKVRRIQVASVTMIEKSGGKGAVARRGDADAKT
jgi:hypothetical protein